MRYSEEVINRIHSTKRARYNKIYTDFRGKEYIGTKEGRLRLREVSLDKEIKNIVTNVEEVKEAQEATEIVTNLDKLLGVVDVDCTITSTTTVYTVPSIRNVFIEQVYGLLIEKDGGTGINAYPTVSIGNNASTDIHMPVRLNKLDTVDEYYHFNTTAVKKLARSSDTIDFTVNNASNATTYQLTIYLFGYEF